MKVHQKPSYHLGLRSTVLRRARFIFGTTLLATLFIFTTTTYVGAKTGQLESTVLKPLRSFIGAIQTTFTSSNVTSNDEAPSSSAGSDWNTSVNIQIKTDFEAQGNIPTSTVESFPLPLTLSQPDYMKTLRAQDEWFRKLSEQNRFEVEKKQRAAEERLQAFKEEGDRRMAEFDAQAQEEMEAFRQEAERKMQEFREKYNFTH